MRSRLRWRALLLPLLPMHRPLRWGLVLLLRLRLEALVLLLLMLHGTRMLLVVLPLRLVPSLPLLVGLLRPLWRIGRRSICCHGHNHAKLWRTIAGWHLYQLERLPRWHARRNAPHHILHGSRLQVDSVSALAAAASACAKW
jgi:hypothetical protein